MKKFSVLILFLAIALLLPGYGLAADAKISADSTKGTPIGADLIPIIDSVGGTNQKATLSSLPVSTPVTTALGGANIPSGTEFGYVKGLTSAVQTQLDGKLPKSLAYAALTAGQYIGNTVPGVCGETLVVGQAVYRGLLGRYWKALADSTSTMPSVGVVAAIEGGGVAGQDCTVLKIGYINTGTFAAATAPVPVYVSRTTAGLITITAPSTVGDQVQLLGHVTEVANILAININEALFEVGTGLVDLAADVTGILPAANGGAGAVSGLLKADGSGTVSAAAAGTDYAAAANGVTSGDSHAHTGGAGAAITEAAITLADNTTNNFSATKHGFAPKIAAMVSYWFLRGDGAWGIPGTRYFSWTSGVSVTPTHNAYDIYRMLGLTGDMTVNATSNPLDYAKLTFFFSDNGTQRNIAWNAQYVPTVANALPTTTTVGQTTICEFIYHNTISKYILMNVQVTN